VVPVGDRPKVLRPAPELACDRFPNAPGYATPIAIGPAHSPRQDDRRVTLTRVAAPFSVLAYSPG